MATMSTASFGRDGSKRRRLSVSMPDVGYVSDPDGDVPFLVPSAAMSVPTEILQQIYRLLGPVDYNSARHTCRAWFFASYDRRLLVQMLKRGGWLTSVLRILARPDMSSAEDEDLRIMSKWISRETTLSDISRSGFVEVGQTDFSGLIPGSTPRSLHGAISFATSLCGRFLLVMIDHRAYVYELNHTCSPEYLGWSTPGSGRQGLRLGSLRPVTVIVCPAPIISFSMDTSAGRNAIAFLLEGRAGVVQDLSAEKLGVRGSNGVFYHSAGFDSRTWSGSSSATSSSEGYDCICRISPPSRPLPAENGSKAVYRYICHPDDPPRSVALCPQRSCVAFGCASGIELHWVDALTGHDLSRWFPVTSPSDFLYFLPHRRGIDSAKKLRLISSAAGIGRPMNDAAPYIHGYNEPPLGVISTSVVSVRGPNRGRPTAREVHTITARVDQQRPVIRSRDLLGRMMPGPSHDTLLRKVSARSADHYRAVPLSDGYHVLFTDPRTGNLCMGTDAPVGSVTRLLRKVWFAPPPRAASPVPLLYTAGSDVRHGVRIIATFSLMQDGNKEEGEGGNGKRATRGGRVEDKQLIVFYTIPPDMFHDISRAGLKSHLAGGTRRLPEDSLASEWVQWRVEETYHEIDIFSDPFRDSTVYPLEIRGQVVAECSNLVEIALDARLEMIIWTFSAEGWARTWVMDTGRDEPCIKSVVQRDGSLRYLDQDGDVTMADTEGEVTSHDDDDECASGFDGGPSSHWMSAPAERISRYVTSRRGDRMSGTVSVDLAEEVNGISRVDVELR
ncbi:unnamed protein product [Clonostachys rhizophaga]|uniref:F-box domain-containing protein n=1 Tax=Clonostachys rhizophaga TaxID=160324 RepID=A0A9N9V381_9HYPO|nr:unnamed protein product [Clonostachys rhizophaga]